MISKHSIILILCFLFASIVGGTVLYLTKDISKTATNFFVEVKNNNYPKAYSYTSNSFKNAASLEELKSFLKKNNLSELKDSKWTHKEITNNFATLKGYIITPNNTYNPVYMILAKTGEEWKIHSFNDIKAGLNNKK